VCLSVAWKNESMIFVSRSFWDSFKSEFLSKTFWSVFIVGLEYNALALIGTPTFIPFESKRLNRKPFLSYINMPSLPRSAITKASWRSFALKQARHSIGHQQKAPDFVEGCVLIAEEEGFEPPEPCGSTVFKTAAFDRSATPLCFAVLFGSANVAVSAFLPNCASQLFYLVSSP
jgi:hypothetical protein